MFEGSPSLDQGVEQKTNQEEQEEIKPESDFEYSFLEINQYLAEKAESCDQKEDRELALKLQEEFDRTQEYISEDIEFLGQENTGEDSLEIGEHVIGLRSAYHGLDNMRKEFFLTQEERNEINSRLEGLRQEIEETDDVSKEEELIREANYLNNQLEPTEYLGGKKKSQELFTDEEKKVMALEIEKIGQEIDKLNLPTLETEGAEVGIESIQKKWKAQKGGYGKFAGEISRKFSEVVSAKTKSWVEKIKSKSDSEKWSGFLDKLKLDKISGKTAFGLTAATVGFMALASPETAEADVDIEYDKEEGSF
ncbi:hypothetical protein ACFLY5_00985, partial [Patescibacteria group bacterium]